MNTRVKKGVFWGALMTPIVLGLCFLFGGGSALAHGPDRHGEGRMGPYSGGFGGRGPQMMHGPHHGDGFPWLGLLLFLIIASAIVFFLVKWLRKKAKASSMQQFIDTSLMSSHRPVMNQNASVLDQWEKNLLNKKENE